MILAFLLQSTTLLALALLLARACSDPSRRAALWFIGISTLPLLALAQVGDFGWHPLTEHLQVAAGMAVAAAPHEASIWPFLTTVYCAIGAWHLLRWGRSLYSIRILLRNSHTCTMPPWSQQSGQLARAMRRRPVPVHTHPDIGSPFLLGGIRPHIVIPAYLERCGEDRVRQILLHEFAHIRSHDWFRTQLIDLICCLLWFHPLIHHVRTRFRTDIELACDEQVLRAGTNPCAYAETLAHCAGQRRQFNASVLAMAAPRAQLVHRVVQILEPRQRHARTRTPWSHAAMLCGAAMLATINLAPRVLIDISMDAVDASEPQQTIAPAQVESGAKPAAATMAPAGPKRASPAVVAKSDVNAGLRVSAREDKRSIPTPDPQEEKPVDTHQIWLSVSSVAASDAQQYALQHSQESLATPAEDSRFEAGARQGRADRSARRERVMRRIVWPALGVIPL